MAKAMKAIRAVKAMKATKAMKAMKSKKAAKAMKASSASTQVPALTDVPLAMRAKKNDPTVYVTFSDEITFKIKVSQAKDFQKWCDLHDYTITSFRCCGPGARELSFH
jgi:hypothetical protein